MSENTLKPWGASTPGPPPGPTGGLKLPAASGPLFNESSLDPPLRYYPVIQVQMHLKYSLLYIIRYIINYESLEEKGIICTFCLDIQM